jgi:signal transduction histidine kinase
LCKDNVVTEDDTITFHLYRIAQEAMNNAIKHGRARRIEIELVRRDNLLLLAVRDFGVGMSPKRGDDAGMGLRVMQYRAGVIGGTLNLERTPRGGTTVICSIPEYFLKANQHPSSK